MDYERALGQMSLENLALREQLDQALDIIRRLTLLKVAYETKYGKLLDSEIPQDL